MATGADWRVGDAEREAVAEQLREHYATGRLTMDEFRSRLDAAYSAVTAADLRRVTADLPSAGLSPAGAAWGATSVAPPHHAPGPARTTTCAASCRMTWAACLRGERCRRPLLPSCRVWAEPV